MVLSCKVKCQNITKNKLLKLVNSRKADFLLAGLYVNISIQKKRQKKEHFMDECFKNKGH